MPHLVKIPVWRKRDATSIKSIKRREVTKSRESLKLANGCIEPLSAS